MLFRINASNGGLSILNIDLTVEHWTRIEINRNPCTHQRWTFYRVLFVVFSASQRVFSFCIPIGLYQIFDILSMHLSYVEIYSGIGSDECRFVFFFKAIFSVRRQETFHSLVKLSYNAEFDHFALSFNRERLRNLLLS